MARTKRPAAAPRRFQDESAAAAPAAAQGGTDIRLVFAFVIMVAAVTSSLGQMQTAQAPLPPAVRVAHGAEGGRYDNFKGHAVFVRDSCPSTAGCAGGGGEDALVLLHGFPTSSRDWDAVWPDLAADGRRVIAPDFLGFGLSDKEFAHTYSIGEQADLVLAVLATAGISRCRIISHDYGDTVAQELLARELEGTLPVQLLSVAMLNGGLFPEVHQPLLVQTLLLHPVTGPVLRTLANGWLFKTNLGKTFGPATQPSEAWLEEAWQLYQHKGGHLLSDKIIRYMTEREKSRARWVGALQESKVPLRFINGPSDVVSGAHMAQRYEELVQNADVASLELWIGHYPQVEAPEAVLAALAGFK